MKRILTFLALIALVITVSSCQQQEKKAKYVFYFIGDGMGFSNVALAEAYQAQTRGVIGMDPLCFTSFPVLGEATTFSASSQVTCSSAAGTALATGFKTKNNMLGMSPDTIPLTSIAYKIHDAGYSVGIMTSVQINHATPAAFYAHNASRGAYYEIGEELPKTGFEFFAAGGIIDPCGSKEPVMESLYKIVADSGYTVACGMEDFNAKKDAEKILLVRSENSEDNLAYSIERKEGDMRLADLVGAAIEVLERDQDGFFLMAEGGLIDWAGHSNDLASTIFEIQDLDFAVKVAYAFYEKHPDETLIVITADHETGGVALGGYSYGYDLTYANTAKNMMENVDVDNYMDAAKTIGSINENARIKWTTTAHCGGPVPVWAIGAGSQKFAARQDNTDIPKKICEAMGIAF